MSISKYRRRSITPTAVLQKLRHPSPLPSSPRPKSCPERARSNKVYNNLFVSKIRESSDLRWDTIRCLVRELSMESKHTKKSTPWPSIAIQLLASGIRQASGLVLACWANSCDSERWSKMHRYYRQTTLKELCVILWFPGKGTSTFHIYSQTRLKVATEVSSQSCPSTSWPTFTTSEEL